MYFTAELQIDPSQATNIEKVKPKYFFQKLLRKITTGSTSKIEEQETFCAISILQQFNAIFKTLNIHNIIRLSKDKIDFYFDEAGIQDDLQQAIDRVEIAKAEQEELLFQHLYLVLEHSENNIHYLIEIQINRAHQVGEYPIDIIIDGVLDEYILQENETVQELKGRMEKNFSSQQAYDTFVKQKQVDFKVFVRKVEQAIKQYIGIDDLISFFQQRVIVPRVLIDDIQKIPFLRDINLEPIFHGYYRYGRRGIYAWLWGDLCHQHKIKLHDCHLINERGGIIQVLQENKEEDIEVQHILKSGIEKTLPPQNEKKKEIDVKYSFSKLWRENVLDDHNNFLDDYSFDKKEEKK